VSAFGGVADVPSIGQSSIQTAAGVVVGSSFAQSRAVRHCGTARWCERETVLHFKTRAGHTVGVGRTTAGPRRVCGSPACASTYCGVTGGPNSLSLRIRSVEDARPILEAGARAPQTELVLLVIASREDESRLSVPIPESLNSPVSPNPGRAAPWTVDLSDAIPRISRLVRENVPKRSRELSKRRPMDVNGRGRP